MKLKVVSLKSALFIFLKFFRALVFIIPIHFNTRLAFVLIHQNYTALIIKKIHSFFKYKTTETLPKKCHA